MQLVVHVGLPKTGSTHLQAQLFHHREALAARGFHVCETATGGLRRPPYNLARELSGDARFEPGAGTWQDVVAELSGCQAPTAFLSCEEFAHGLRDPATLSRLAEVAGRAGREAVVLAVVREPLGWLNSLYQQDARDLHVTLPFDPWWRQAVAAGLADPATQFEAVFEHPDLRFVAIPFDEVRARPPLPTVAAALGADLGGAELAEVAGGENPAVGSTTVAVACEAAKRLQRDGAFDRYHPRFKLVRRQFREAAEAAGWNRDRFWGWTPASRAEAEPLLRPAYDAFSQRVWGRPWPAFPTVALDAAGPRAWDDLAEGVVGDAEAILETLRAVASGAEATAELPAPGLGARLRGWWRARA